MCLILFNGEIHYSDSPPTLHQENMRISKTGRVQTAFLTVEAGSSWREWREAVPTVIWLPTDLDRYLMNEQVTNYCSSQQKLKHINITSHKMTEQAKLNDLPSII